MARQTDHIQISITFRNTESTPALKTYATDKIANCLSKYLTYETKADVVLSVQKLDHVAEVKVHSKGYDVSGKAVTQDLYSAIDKVVDTVVAQIRKQKERVAGRKHHTAEL